ncbi:MAG TPA: fibrinogen-like YCDxxxxGGGW domain-containing protein, partial [Polyangiaceae bacterium]|nr:fibrinogen-like YCDxxxxGGGW domain-containing protein [Polyangiaceae bacterium]
MRRKHVVFVTALGIAIAAFGGYQVRRANAFGIPATDVLTYRGTLSDVSGVPITGAKNIQLAVWNQRDGGSQVCATASMLVNLANGTFQVPLGDACAEAVRNSPDLWLEVLVDGATLGRSKFGAVPYAIEARTASNAAGSLAAAIDELRTKLASAFASVPGGSPQYAGVSCAALRDAGVKASGNYWVKVPAPADGNQTGKAILVYCDQVTNDGGWALVYNSVLLPNTLDFWNIPYAARLTRRGVPSLGTNFYDGSLYQT